MRSEITGVTRVHAMKEKVPASLLTDQTVNSFVWPIVSFPPSKCAMQTDKAAGCDDLKRPAVQICAGELKSRGITIYRDMFRHGLIRRGKCIAYRWPGVSA